MTARPHSLSLVPMLALAVLGLQADVSWAEKKDAGWPCPQRKVPKLSVGQFWDGPPLDGVSPYPTDAAAQDLIGKLASRRHSLEEITPLIETFAKAQPEADRDARLTQVFAGVFHRVNTERGVVLDGIERFEQRQKQRSAELEREGTRITKLKDVAAADEKAQSELVHANELFDWNVRIFQERQNSMPIACEIPVLIEQRLYEIAKAIRAQMHG